MIEPGAAAGIDWSAVALPGLGPGRVVVVTGAGGEMGGGVATALMAMGVRVALLGRTRSTLEDTLARSVAPDNGIVVTCDVTDQESVRDAFAHVASAFGRIDGVAHCAATGDGSVAADEVSIELAEAIMRSDFIGPLLVAQVAAPYLRKARGGSIVFVSSVAAHRVMPGGSTYGSAKAAATRLARSLAVEWGRDGIRVNVMSPGQTPTLLRTTDVLPDSPGNYRAGAGAGQVPLGRRGATDDYVGAILFLLSELSQYVTGADIPVEGGVLWPRTREA